MQPLPELTPAADRDVLDLLGPDLMLLKSPAAAEAAVFAQHSARELQRQRSASLRGSSFSAGREGTFSRSLTLSATRSLGLSFRSSSGTARRKSLTVTRSTGSKGRSTVAAADIRAAPQPAGEQLSLGSSGVPVSAQQHHHPSTAANSIPDTQQPVDIGSSSQAPAAWPEGLATPSTVSEEENSLCTAAGVLSPFQLHQVELAHKQQEAALKRQQTSLQRQRQASLQDRASFSMRLSSMRLGSMRQSSSLRLSRQGSVVHCSGGSPTAGGLRCSGSGCVLDVDVDPSSCIQEDLGGEAAAAAAATAAAAAGKGGSLQEAGLPVAVKSHCRRLTHDSCCHTAELEAKMTRKIEDQASHQVKNCCSRQT
jgi:hypothetical protein